jgi:transcriptional antiterminator RfaH
MHILQQVGNYMVPSNIISWYVVQLKPNSHKIALRNLQRQGFETFLPMHEVTRRTAVKFETAIRPLFAGYMFVACDREQAPWRQINSTYGIARMLGREGEGLTPMPEALIAGLRARCDSVGKVLPLESFEPGQSVEMHSGPFANFIATVEQMASDARVWVLLDFMGKETRVQVERQQIQAVLAG